MGDDLLSSEKYEIILERTVNIEQFIHHTEQTEASSNNLSLSFWRLNNDPCASSNFMSKLPEQNIS